MHTQIQRIGFAALLALVVCALAISGCGGEEPTKNATIARYSQELREAVSTNVPQGARREQMLVVVDQLQALQFRFSQETTDFIQSYRKLNADYDAPRATFDKLFGDYRAKRVGARNEAFDLHFQLASLATAGEWDKLAKAESKLYEEVNAALPGEDASK